MSSLSHPDTCRCSLHAQLAARRHECYRQLAKAILGPAAPQEDLALARALAEHAVTIGAIKNVTPIHARRAA
ncbi:MAG: hypothetical protein JO020_10400 [Chloroflexi bacterium]|nr:hypothetical protein [Chloroflexota bacterium]MBV9894571.1 hypothetical protein [Chloroflexota bacterium]